jgi:hypothetical protein
MAIRIIPHCCAFQALQYFLNFSITSCFKTEDLLICFGG